MLQSGGESNKGSRMGNAETARSPISTLVVLGWGISGLGIMDHGCGALWIECFVFLFFLFFLFSVFGFRVCGLLIEWWWSKDGGLSVSIVSGFNAPNAPFPPEEP